MHGDQDVHDKGDGMGCGSGEGSLNCTGYGAGFSSPGESFESGYGSGYSDSGDDLGDGTGQHNCSGFGYGRGRTNGGHMPMYPKYRGRRRTIVVRVMGEKPPVTREPGSYVIVRTYAAGVFSGVFVSRADREVVLANARRLWYWAGAATLSELATTGTKLPAECKFPCAVERVELFQVIEILDVTEQARKSIEAVPVWCAPDTPTADTADQTA